MPWIRRNRRIHIGPAKAGSEAMSRTPSLLVLPHLRPHPYPAAPIPSGQYDSLSSMNHRQFLPWHPPCLAIGHANQTRRSVMNQRPGTHGKCNSRPFLKLKSTSSGVSHHHNSTPSFFPFAASPWSLHLIVKTALSESTYDFPWDPDGLTA